jgi:hypothetical protein
MSRLIMFLLIATSTAMGCYKDGIEKDTPHCVASKISVFAEASCNEGANVKQYRFQGIHVYVFDHGTCGADFTSEVIDTDCNTLGYLGGITGNTKINGEDFSNAVFIKTTWKK